MYSKEKLKEDEKKKKKKEPANPQMQGYHPAQTLL